MRVVVLGTRGFPNIAGGIERHCEELYPRLARLGCDVHVLARRSYYPRDQRPSAFGGVRFSYLYAPRAAALEALAHTALGLLYARRQRPQILHVHGIGPSLLMPVARALGLKVVVTHHGADYERAQWGALARAVLRFGERLGVRYADRVIVVSEHIRRALASRCPRRDLIVIPNGARSPTGVAGTRHLRSLGLEPDRYVLGVGRFVEDKGFHDLLDAFSRIDARGVELVLVGSAPRGTRYGRRLTAAARAQDAILTGPLHGEALREVFANARLFVIPSLYEGLPIALLEAMGHGCDVLASDIPANLAVGLRADDCFRAGDVIDLARALERKLGTRARHDYYDLLKERYDWDRIASATLAVYEELACR